MILNDNSNNNKKYDPISSQFDKRAIYQGYINSKRKIITSPDDNVINNPFNERLEIKNIQNIERHSKSPLYKSFSPKVCEVYMPDGITYNAETDVPKTGSQSQRGSNRKLLDKKTESPKYETYTPPSIQRVNSFRSTNEQDSDSDSDTISSKSSQRRRDKRKEEKMLMKILIADYMERQEDKKKQIKNTPSVKARMTPGYEIPKNEEVVGKSRIPDYENFSEIDKEKIREKFRNNYNTLIAKYPRWKIEMPDFNLLPLRLIHERYEEVVKTICIYQTAMKWKVYIIIIIAAIEYYGCNVKKYDFLRGLLKAQIKTIHKFDTYLVEFAEPFYSEQVVEEYPLWMRALGTFLSGIGSFSSINAAAKFFGEDASPPDYIFEQADKFVSPPEGTAKLHSDGISDVPEPPTGLQDPNGIIGIIGSLFGLFTGQNAPATTQTKSETAPVKARVVDDFEDAEF